MGALWAVTLVLPHDDERLMERGKLILTMPRPHCRGSVSDLPIV